MSKLRIFKAEDYLYLHCSALFFSCKGSKISLSVAGDNAVKHDAICLRVIIDKSMYVRVDHVHLSTIHLAFPFVNSLRNQ